MTLEAEPVRQHREALVGRKVTHVGRDDDPSSVSYRHIVVHFDDGTILKYTHSYLIRTRTSG